MMNGGEDLVDVVIVGVVLMILGSALAPILPINFTPIGALLVLLAVVAAAVTVVGVIAGAMN